MKQPSSIPLSAVFALAVVVSTGRAEQPSQVVVLFNGSVVQGRLEKTDDGWKVSNGPWYTVHVRANDVDFVAKDLPAAYREKLSRIPPRSFDEHLRLAQWCMRHELNGLAADRLLHLAKLDPHHAAVQTLEEQLRRRANRPLEMASTVQTASIELPVEAADGDELPKLSSEAVSQFTRSIQPLMMNRCGQATCHGSASQNGFRMMGTNRRYMGRESTWKNLRAALTFIESLDADATSLVRNAATLHGTATREPIQPHEQRQYQSLVDWVEMVIRDQAPQSAVGSPSYDASAGHGEPWVGPVPQAHPVERAYYEQPVLSEDDPVDPFDPAAFNARFAPGPAESDELPQPR